MADITRTADSRLISSILAGPSPSAPLTGPVPPKAAPAPAAPTPAPTTNRAAPAGESRWDQQQRYAGNMWKQLGQDSRLAAIMLNPIFMIHAQAISTAATTEAIRRYEVEVPQQDFSVINQQEQAKARQAILALPDRYAKYGADALDATGAVLLDAVGITAAVVSTAYDATTTAVSGAYDATANAANQAYNSTTKAVGQAYDATAAGVSDAYNTTTTAVSDAADYTAKTAKRGFFVTVGAMVEGWLASLHGLGHMLRHVGEWASDKGDKLQKAS